jgi:hypothetical protein
MEEGDNFTQASLLQFYQEISYSNESPLSESFFREYFQMERGFTEASKEFLEEVYQSASCHCITKGNLYAIIKTPLLKVTSFCCLISISTYLTTFFLAVLLTRTP